MVRRKFRILKPILPNLLMSLRFLLVLWPQTGYIHPDEFFQSSEIVAGDVFNVEVFRTWEFNSTNPIRSIAFPYIFCGIPFVFLKAASIVLSVPTIHPYFLLVLPRLAITAFSLLIDVYLRKLCILFRREYTPVLIIFSTSYVSLTYLTRTFSNSIETVLFAALLFYVSKSITDITNAAEKTKSVVNPNAIAISCLTVAGVFNRPTFLVFAFTPLMFWLQFGPNHTVIRKVRFRLNSLIPGAILTGFVFAVCDTAYYKGIPITSSEVFARDILDKLVVTPWNFIKYNLNTANLSKHGLHPFWLHGLINIPVLFGYLGVIGYMKYWKMLFQVFATGMLRINVIRALFSCSFIFPLLLLSLFEHQEPRFLIPLIFPLVYLHGNRIWTKKWTSASRFVWLAFNAVCLFHYGFFQQSGVVRCALNIGSKIHPRSADSPLIFVFFHTYMAPKFLFKVQFFGADTDVVDLGGANFSVLNERLLNVFKSEAGAQVYTIMPASVSLNLPPSYVNNYNFSLVARYSPHFTAEDFPVVDSALNSSNWYYALRAVYSQLYLDVWQLSVK